MEPMELLLPYSVPICHIPLFISINYPPPPQKTVCLLSINRNHSPMEHLIMRPHTELRLRAAHYCLGRPASNPSSRSLSTPPPPTAGEQRTGGGRCEAETAPKGLLNEEAARCRQSAWGRSQVHASTKGNITGLTESSLHETSHGSVHRYLITQHGFLSENNGTSCSRREELLAQRAAEVEVNSRFVPG